MRLARWVAPAVHPNTGVRPIQAQVIRPLSNASQSEPSEVLDDIVGFQDGIPMSWMMIWGVEFSSHM